MGLGNAMTRILLQNGAKVRFISVKLMHLNIPVPISVLLCACDRFFLLIFPRCPVTNQLFSFRRKTCASYFTCMFFLSYQDKTYAQKHETRLQFSQEFFLRWSSWTSTTLLDKVSRKPLTKSMDRKIPYLSNVMQNQRNKSKVMHTASHRSAVIKTFITVKGRSAKNGCTILNLFSVCKLP